MKLKVEIVYDKHNNKTRVLIWEGIVIVENMLFDGEVENTENQKEKLREAYKKGLTNE